MGAPYNYVTLLYGVTGQEVHFYPPMSEVLRDGAPTVAASYRVFRGMDSNDGTPVLSGTATLEAISTTVSFASGYSADDRTAITLTSTTGIKSGRRYLLQNLIGERELVTVVSVSSGMVTVEEPLAYDYELASTFVGLRQVFTVDPTFIQSISSINVQASWQATSGKWIYVSGETDSRSPPYRVEWAYTTTSIPRRTWTTFDVERKQAKANLSIVDLRELIPDVHFFEWLGQRGQDFLPQLNLAEKDVFLDIRAAGYDGNAVLDPQIWDRLVLQKWAIHVVAAFMFASSRGSDPWLDKATSDYDKMLNKFVSSQLKLWMSQSTSGDLSPKSPRQMWLSR